MNYLALVVVSFQERELLPHSLLYLSTTIAGALELEAQQRSGDTRVKREPPSARKVLILASLCRGVLKRAAGALDKLLVPL